MSSQTFKSLQCCNIEESLTQATFEELFIHLALVKVTYDKLFVYVVTNCYFS